MFAKRLPGCWKRTRIVRVWVLVSGLLASNACCTDSHAQTIRINLDEAKVRSLDMPKAERPPQALSHSGVVTASHAIPVLMAQDLEISVPEPIVSQSGNVVLGELNSEWSDAGEFSRQPMVPLGSVSAYGTMVSMPSYDGFQMGCLGAKHWTPSAILRSRAKAIIQLYCDEDECSRHAAAVLANFLRMEACHQEGIGAASAMRGYYTRIGLADQLALNSESKEAIRGADSKQQALLDQGLAAGVDRTEFDRLLLEVRGAELEILSKDRKLQSLLSELCKVDYPMNGIQQEPLEVVESSLDCAALQSIALATRMDLKAWMYLQCHVNEETAPIFAKMLPTLIGGYSFPLPTVCGLKKLFCKPDYSCLAANMRHEIQLTIETHRRWISQAIIEKCNDLVLAYQKIELAQKTLASWEKRRDQLEKLESLGESRPVDLAAARTEILKARSEIISRKIEARNAEVSLAEATGGLARRCCSRTPWLLTGY